MLSQLTFIVPTASSKYDSTEDFNGYTAVVSFITQKGIKVADITRSDRRQKQMSIKALDEPKRSNDVIFYRIMSVQPSKKVFAGCAEIIDRICSLLESGEFVTELFEEELDYSASSIEPT